MSIESGLNDAADAHARDVATRQTESGVRLQSC
jgi:hypothetical protein